MTSLHKQIQNNKLNIEFTENENKALQQFIISGDYDLENIHLESALYKIGERVPITNRGCLGKNIRSLLFK